MGLKIEKITPRSLADSLGLIPGDKVLAIDKQPLRDIVDYIYLSGNDNFCMEVGRNGTSFQIQVERLDGEEFGITFVEDEVLLCKNRCIFCFVHQLPKGMRKALYIKDEDYRLSFLHGHYITLSNLSEEDYQRIVQMRLSPLYISVHSTEPRFRQKILKGCTDIDILERIGFLARNGINLHCQIVLCPGINDEEHLEKTVFDIAQFFPSVSSVAVVPVGLTRYRKNLPPLKTVNRECALHNIELIENWQRALIQKLGTRFVWVADEFYILAGRNFPSGDYYEDSPQIENGVGLVRRFIDDFRKNRKKLPKMLSKPLSFVLVTGSYGASFMPGIVRQLNKIEGLSVEFVAVENKFWGGNVAVSGLLTGKDICNTLAGKFEGKTVLLPPNCVNYDGIMLDDMSPEQIGEKIGARVVVGDYNLVDTLLAEFSKQ